MASGPILLVDDDAPLRRLIGSFLVEHGYPVLEAENADEARRKLVGNPIEIAVLDVMMPGEDGLSLARSLSERTDIGIIMVSALGSETDRIIGLEVGADDYLAKPVSPRELLARIRALARRRQSAISGAAGATYRFCGWTLDPIHRVLRDRDEVRISLSDGEFGLLLALVERPMRVLSRDQLLEFVKRGDYDVFDRAVDTQISRLRRKLATRGDEEIIRTVRNEGYMFIPRVTRGHARL